MKLLKNKIIFGAVLLTVVLTGSAQKQEIKVDKGPSAIEDRLWNSRFCVGHNENQVYIFNEGLDAFQIECQNTETLNKEYIKNLDIPFKVIPPQKVGSRIYFITKNNLFYNNGKLIFLGCSFDKKKNSISVVSQTFTAKTGEPTGQYSILFDEPILKDKFADFNFIQSEDGSRVLILKRMGKESVYNYRIIDFDRNTISEGRINDVTTENTSATHIKLDSKGNIIFIQETLNNKSKWINQDESYSYKLVIHNTTKNTDKEFKLDPENEDEIFISLKYALKDNKITITAISVSLKSMDKSDIVYKSFDMESGTFNAQTTNGMENTPHIRAHGPDIVSDYYISDIIPKDKGGVFVILSESGAYRHNDNTQITQRDKSIIILSFDENDKLVWEEKIENPHSYYNQYELYSFYTDIINNELVVLYNEQPGFGRLTDMIATNFNESGEMTQNKVIDYADKTSQVLAPTYFYKINNNTLITLAIVKKDYSVYKLSFK